MSDLYVYDKGQAFESPTKNITGLVTTDVDPANVNQFTESMTFILDSSLRTFSVRSGVSPFGRG